MHIYIGPGACFSVEIHLAGHGIKGKLGEDVGQQGIRAGDTRVSHTSPKSECGTPWYHQ